MLSKLNFVFLLFMLSCDAQPLESNEPLIPIDNYVLKSGSPIDGNGTYNKVTSSLNYPINLTEKYIKTLHELMHFCKSSPESELKTIPALIVKVFEDIQDGDALAYNVSSQYLEDYLQSVQHPAAIKALNDWFAQNDLPYTIPHTSQD